MNKTSNGPESGLDAVRGNTITELLRHRAETAGSTPVLLASSQSPSNWQDLWTQLEDVGQNFAGWGLPRDARVAVVLPDGPALAAAFLTISSWATFAPLNPAYKEDEFDFYLGDLRAKALVLPQGLDSPARSVAQKRGISILELRTDPTMTAGRFELHSSCSGTKSAPRSWAGPDDIALILHTSGTTSRPKIVPLSHRNLCSSAGHIARTLRLAPEDRGLCVMPLFHIHGLIGALLSSIWAGSGLICPPGFSASGFFEALREFKPTWYSAVPTMHQALLARARENPELVHGNSLRFIRSSSAALPPSVMQGLEEVFGAPVIEAYGMTEASHQMASNPLPPAARKPGSVGLAAGPEIAIMDKAGALLPNGQAGEIVIRGPNVTAGYENNPAANAAAFTNGWFRTGDQGHLDNDGYLFITGRLKEIINRGGEKIAPREIDEALLSYPGVRQAVAFAVRHPTLGEDLNAAVVSDGQRVTEPELRRYLAQRLPPFKIPTRIVFLKEIPKGPTGKVQRIGLADRLTKDLAVAYEPPADQTETLIVQVFQQVLGREGLGRRDNFFSAGGDSIRAMQAASRLREPLGVEVPVALLFQAATAAGLADEVKRLQEEREVGVLARQLEQLPAEEVERLLGSSSSEPNRSAGEK